MEGLSQETALGFRQHPTQTQSYTTATMNVRFSQKGPFGAALSDELVVCSNSKPTAGKKLESRYP